jgi:dienelactone hydrolase
MHYGLELCRRGFVVMCPDHLCFEDRRPSEKERRGNPYLQDASYERFEATKRFLEGSSLQAKYLSDLSRAADVLAMRPEVDADRLGTIGHSLGGQEALWLCWYDERIKAGVSSCGFSLISCILRDRINHNMAMYAPGLLKVCDLDEILASIAPRAFMMINGRDDRIFPADGVERTAKRAREVYNSLGAGDRFSSITFPGGHSFPAEMRSAAYESLSRWLGASGAKSQAGS